MELRALASQDVHNNVSKLGLSKDETFLLAEHADVFLDPPALPLPFCRTMAPLRLDNDTGMDQFLISDMIACCNAHQAPIGGVHALNSQTDTCLPSSALSPPPSTS